MERSTSKARYHTQFKYCQFPKHEEGEKDGQQKNQAFEFFSICADFQSEGTFGIGSPLTHIKCGAGQL